MSFHAWMREALMSVDGHMCVDVIHFRHYRISHGVTSKSHSFRVDITSISRAKRERERERERERVRNDALQNTLRYHVDNFLMAHIRIHLVQVCFVARLVDLQGCQLGHATMKEAETESEANTKAEKDDEELEKRINAEMNQLLAERPHEELAHQNETAEIRAREINDAIKASIKKELEEKNTELKKELKELKDAEKAKAKAQPKLNTPTTTTEILAGAMMTETLAEIPTETEAPSWHTKTEPKNDDKTEAKTMGRQKHRPFRGVSGDKPWWFQAAPKAPKPAATPKITPPEPTAVAPPPAAPRPVSLVRQGHGNRCSSCNAWCPLDNFKPAPQGYLPAPPAPPPSKLPEPLADRLDKSLKNIEAELKWLRNNHGHIMNSLKMQERQISRQDEQLKKQNAQMEKIIRLLS